MGVVDEFEVGEQKLCRREFGGGRRVEHHTTRRGRLCSSVAITILNRQHCSWSLDSTPFNAIAILNR